MRRCAAYPRTGGPFGRQRVTRISLVTHPAFIEVLSPCLDRLVTKRVQYDLVLPGQFFPLPPVVAPPGKLLLNHHFKNRDLVPASLPTQRSRPARVAKPRSVRKTLVTAISCRQGNLAQPVRGPKSPRAVRRERPECALADPESKLDRSLLPSSLRAVRRVVEATRWSPSRLSVFPGGQILGP